MPRLTFHAMGCQMLAALDVEDESAVERLARVPEWFEVWEQRLSRFRPESELSRLNRLPDKPVRVSGVLYEVVRAALAAAAATGGLVSPTVASALEAAGYDRSFERLRLSPPGGETKEATVGDWRLIACDPGRCSIQLPSGTRLDLGGITKGWAADRAARRLRHFGPALVDAGGDIAVSGLRADGQPWPVAVADPRAAGAQLELLMLAGGGVATSGRDYRRWPRDGTWQHHIIDPRTARPAATDVLTATVVAPKAQQAEVAAKAALLLGSREGLAWIESRPPLAGLLVLEDGRVLRSRRWGRFVWR